jgi:hypothetical protein
LPSDDHARNRLIHAGADAHQVREYCARVLFAKLVFNMETIDAATLERILALPLTAAKQPAKEAPRSAGARAAASPLGATRRPRVTHERPLEALVVGVLISG